MDGPCLWTPATLNLPAPAPDSGQAHKQFYRCFQQCWKAPWLAQEQQWPQQKFAYEHSRNQLETIKQTCILHQCQVAIP
jgi:hypothetical protein